MSLKGNRYFYENPLEAGKNRVRWAWHACPCCPPMFLKLMGAMPGYVYAAGERGLYVNLYVGSVVRTRVGGGRSDAAPDDAISLGRGRPAGDRGQRAGGIRPQPPRAVVVPVGGVLGGLYSPQGGRRTGAFVVRVNGQPASPTTAGGYARLRREWQPGDVVEITMAMPVRRPCSPIRACAAAGRVALQRGPIVYCLESIDNEGRVQNASCRTTPSYARNSAPTCSAGSQ